MKTKLLPALFLALVITNIANATTHTVVAGDTLAIIAQRHGVTMNALRKSNHLKDDKIIIGQRLKLPAKAVTPSNIADEEPLSCGPFKPMATTPLPSDNLTNGNYASVMALKEMDVLSIQIMLRSRGLCPGPSDAKMGDATIRALERYSEMMRTDVAGAAIYLIEKSRNECGLPYEERTLKDECLAEEVAQAFETTVEGLARMNKGFPPYAYLLPKGIRLFVPKKIPSEFDEAYLKMTFE